MFFFSLIWVLNACLDEEHLKLEKQVRKNSRRPKTTCTDNEEEEEKDEEQLERDSVSTTEEEAGEDQSDDDCGKLDRDLERKSRQHNLTAVNVRDILHVGVLNTLFLFPVTLEFFVLEVGLQNNSVEFMVDIAHFRKFLPFCVGLTLNSWPKQFSAALDLSLVTVCAFI